jgi:hypothetical protein
VYGGTAARYMRSGLGANRAALELAQKVELARLPGPLTKMRN